MGKRGPNKTPTEELQRRGSWRAKQPDRVNEIKLPIIDKVPPVPSWLPKEEHKEYSRVAGILAGEKLMTVADADMVAHLVAAVAPWRARCAHDTAGVPVLETETGLKRNPLIGMIMEAHRDCIRIMRELGMSPASRVGLVLQKVDDIKAGDILDFNGGFAT